MDVVVDDNIVAAFVVVDDVCVVVVVVVDNVFAVFVVDVGGGFCCCGVFLIFIGVSDGVVVVGWTTTTVGCFASAL